MTTEIDLKLSYERTQAGVMARACVMARRRDGLCDWWDLFGINGNGKLKLYRCIGEELNLNLGTFGQLYIDDY